MSLLSIDKLAHSFGDRTLFTDVSFRLLAGEHVGLVHDDEHHHRTADS